MINDIRDNTFNNIINPNKITRNRIANAKKVPVSDLKKIEALKPGEVFKGIYVDGNKTIPYSIHYLKNVVSKLQKEVMQYVPTSSYGQELQRNIQNVKQTANEVMESAKKTSVKVVDKAKELSQAAEENASAAMAGLLHQHISYNKENIINLLLSKMSKTDIADNLQKAEALYSEMKNSNPIATSFGSFVGVLLDSTILTIGISKDCSENTDLDPAAGNARAFVKAFFQGVTLNFSDELESISRSISTHTNFEKCLSTVRQDYSKFRKLYPSSTFIGEITGGQANSVVIAPMTFFFGTVRGAVLASTQTLSRTGIALKAFQAGRNLIAAGKDRIRLFCRSLNTGKEIMLKAISNTTNRVFTSIPVSVKKKILDGASNPSFKKLLSRARSAFKNISEGTINNPVSKKAYTSARSIFDDISKDKISNPVTEGVLSGLGRSATGATDNSNKEIVDNIRRDVFEGVATTFLWRIFPAKEYIAKALRYTASRILKRTPSEGTIELVDKAVCEISKATSVEFLIPEIKQSLGYGTEKSELVKKDGSSGQPDKPPVDNSY